MYELGRALGHKDKSQTVMSRYVCGVLVMSRLMLGMLYPAYDFFDAKGIVDLLAHFASLRFVSVAGARVNTAG